MISDIDVKKALRQWLASANGTIDADSITDDLPLLSERIVTSLQVTDLLLFIEDLRGRPVEVDEIRASSFQDIDQICKTFFEGENPCV